MSINIECLSWNWIGFTPVITIHTVNPVVYYIKALYFPVGAFCLASQTRERNSPVSDARPGPHSSYVLGPPTVGHKRLGEQIEAMSRQISQHLEQMGQPQRDDDDPSGSEVNEALTWRTEVELLDTIPGVDRRTAEIILAEIGLDMSQFPSADDLASWAGFAPGNHQSGGKRYSGRTTKGNRSIGADLNQAAWAASRTKDTYLKARYHRLAARRGKKRAIVAIGRSILVSIWHMLSRHEPYQDLGADYYDQRRKDTKVSYFTKQLAKLGFVVSLDPAPTPA